MSWFRYFASDRALPEIDLSGFVQMKAKDIKKMRPLPLSPIPLDKIDDNADVLFAASEDDIGGLQISLCTNILDEIIGFTNKKYVYDINGNYDSKCINQLQEYLHTNFQPTDRIELWSIWVGDKLDKIYRRRIQPSDIMGFDFTILNHSNCCIMIREPYNG